MSKGFSDQMTKLSEIMYDSVMSLVEEYESAVGREHALDAAKHVIRRIIAEERDARTVRFVKYGLLRELPDCNDKEEAFAIQFEESEIPYGRMTGCKVIDADANQIARMADSSTYESFDDKLRRYVQTKRFLRKHAEANNVH